MLGGGEQDAFFHQAGGIADAGDVAAVSFNFEIVEIHAAEDDAGVRRRGYEAEAAGNGGVESDSGCVNGALYRRLARHRVIRCIYLSFWLHCKLFIFMCLERYAGCVGKGML